MGTKLETLQAKLAKIQADIEAEAERVRLSLLLLRGDH